MTFLWPAMLWLLLAVPAVIAVYVYVLRRKKRAALQYANLAMVKAAMGAPSLRRHVPPALFLLAFVLMLLSIARPAGLVMLPTQQETVILAMDVSGSMRATDVKPSRFEAMQAAARDFVNGQSRTTRIGVVAFAGSASLVQAPTQNHADVLAAIDQFQMQNATAIGAGILVSLKAIFPEGDFDLQPQRRNGAAGASSIGRDPQKDFQPVAPGSYGNAVVILLTDGQTTTGPDPIEAARKAAERGVRVYTVGVGTPNGEILTGEGWSIRVRLDEDALKQIADMTRGEYFFAGTAGDLKKVYEGMKGKLVMEKKETEVTALFSALATCFALVSVLLSLFWFNRVL
ncbi:MAG TPA: VWA domain-containing protein [Burkholderiales bacterium]|nr:VWA domain-containing protein [Burkholderiales bacterium]